MDNASFHHSERITQMCADAGVKLIYLPPYSPDLNPIEEFFVELKSFIRRSWCYYVENRSQGFDHFLDWCIEAVGAKRDSAEGHFRHAGLTNRISGTSARISSPEWRFVCWMIAFICRYSDSRNWLDQYTLINSSMAPPPRP